MAPKHSNRTTDTAIAPALTLEAASRGGAVLRLSGNWTTRNSARLEPMVEAFDAGTTQVSHIDLSEITQIDTAGAWLLGRLHAKLSEAGEPVSFTGELADSELIRRVLNAGALVPDPLPPQPAMPLRFLEFTGRTAHAFWQDLLMAFDILGAAVRGAQAKPNGRTRLSITPIVAHVERMGVGAVPIVVLMATIIGAIIAQQGAFQLRYFGAELYVVDLVGILVLREIGVLITAIMIAGRSGSAITAEIGSMKMREEVDALKVMGLNPVAVLVFPRLVALVIALPILTIIANFAALAGAAAVASVYSGISPDAFIARMREAIDLSSVFSGLIKAPFMALIIGVIAAVEGLKVKGSAESLGLCVTRSVVKAIFVVIVVDGLFAMFYAAIDF
ncbi:MAG: MlaE family lipid ABC transporter permease subunit [Rhizobiaceae bacterium]|nr:MlaE family lipid ABC transporter permease subunit [Rhizobiaceae bacterium]